jgi:hypothetical protein
MGDQYCDAENDQNAHYSHDGHCCLLLCHWFDHLNIPANASFVQIQQRPSQLSQIVSRCSNRKLARLPK